MTGTSVRVKGIQRFREKKTGKIYCYHRASGERLKEEFGTAAFFAELAAVEAAHSKKKLQNAKPDTLEGAIEAYGRSSFFQELAEKTRKDYKLILNRVAASIGGMPLARIDKPFLARLRDGMAEKRGFRTANITLVVLSNVFKLAEENGYMNSNPVEKLRKAKRPDGETDANRPWTEAERKAVLAAAPPHLRLPIALGVYTGLRKNDAISLLKTAVRDGWLYHETLKRKVDVCLPLSALGGLADEIGRAPAHGAVTLCASSRGTPWTRDGFYTSFSRLLHGLEEKAAIAPGLTFHGLRHTIGGALAEMGLSRGDIALWLGQKTENMAAHYSRRADKKRRMEGVALKLEGAQKRRRAEE